MGRPQLEALCASLVRKQATTPTVNRLRCSHEGSLPMLHRTYLEAKVQTVKVARQVRGQEAIGHILALVTEAPVTSASLLVTCFFARPP